MKRYLCATNGVECPSIIGGPFVTSKDVIDAAYHRYRDGYPPGDDPDDQLFELLVSTPGDPKLDYVGNAYEFAGDDEESEEETLGEAPETA